MYIVLNWEKLDIKTLKFKFLISTIHVTGKYRVPFWFTPENHLFLFQHPKVLQIASLIFVYKKAQMKNIHIQRMNTDYKHIMKCN